MTTFENIRGDTRRQVVEVLKAVPGLTAQEVLALMPGASPSSVMSIVSRLHAEGTLIVHSKKRIIAKNNTPRTVVTYAVNPDPNPSPQPPLRVTVKRKKSGAPTPNAYEMRISELKAKVAELENWKAEALKRYADLAVSPSVLKARSLVAKELDSAGDHAQAEHVRSGHRDGILPMRVAIKLLEEMEGA